MKYRVQLCRVASQWFEVEADDADEAIEKAFAIGMDRPNISNGFEFDGDDELGGVFDEDMKQVREGEGMFR